MAMIRNDDGGGAMPMHSKAAFEECDYRCREGCIAPLRHKPNAITGATGVALRLRRKHDPVF
jgi:hypothetical protein